MITNYFTRMRYCSAEGRLDLVSKGPLQAPEGPAATDPALKAWFLHENRRAADERIVFGHWAALEGRTGVDTAIALDTGCVWGGHMTLYCLETGQREICTCRDGVAASRHCMMALSVSQPGLDIPRDSRTNVHKLGIKLLE